MTITTVSCIPISKHQPLVKEKKTSHPAKLLQNFRRPIHTGEFLFILEKYFLSAPVWRTMILFSKFCWLTPKFKSATTYRLSQSRSLLVGQSRRERVHSAPNVREQFFSGGYYANSVLKEHAVNQAIREWGETQDLFGMHRGNAYPFEMSWNGYFILLQILYFLQWICVQWRTQSRMIFLKLTTVIECLCG